MAAAAPPTRRRSVPAGGKPPRAKRELLTPPVGRRIARFPQGLPAGVTYQYQRRPLTPPPPLAPLSRAARLRPGQLRAVGGPGGGPGAVDDPMLGTLARRRQAPSNVGRTLREGVAGSRAARDYRRLRGAVVSAQAATGRAGDAAIELAAAAVNTAHAAATSPAARREMGVLRPLGKAAIPAVASQALVATIQTVAPGEYGALIAVIHTMPLLWALLAKESPVAAVIATLTASGVRIFLQALITYIRALKEYLESDRTPADRRAAREALVDFLVPSWADPDTQRVVALHTSELMKKEAAKHGNKLWWQRIRGDPPLIPVARTEKERKAAAKAANAATKAAAKAASVATKVAAKDAKAAAKAAAAAAKASAAALPADPDKRVKALEKRLRLTELAWVGTQAAELAADVALHAGGI